MMLDLGRSQEWERARPTWPEDYVDTTVLAVSEPGTLRFESHGIQAVTNEVLELIGIESVKRLGILHKLREDQWIKPN